MTLRAIAFSLFAVLLMPVAASGQGDPAAFADAYDKCMSHKPMHANKCYRFSCFYQGCIAQHSSRLMGGAVAVQDPGLRRSAVASCLPHIQAMTQCIKENGVLDLPTTAEPNEPKEPDQPNEPNEPKTPRVTNLSCNAKDNVEKSCCCFLGSHTYQFEPQQVGTATVTFDTGRRFDCKSVVSIDALVGETWTTLQSVKANSSSGGSERAPRTLTVDVGKVIGGIRVGDGCVCCIDDSKVTLN